MKSWLEKNNIEKYSTHNEGKSVVAEIFTRTLKNKIYKYVTWTSKNLYIDELDEIVNKSKSSQLMLKIIHILTLIKRMIKRS